MAGVSLTALRLSHSTITLVGTKKRKRNASSDHSDGELSPASPTPLEEDIATVHTRTQLHAHTLYRRSD